VAGAKLEGCPDADLAVGAWPEQIGALAWNRLITWRRCPIGLLFLGKDLLLFFY